MAKKIAFSFETFIDCEAVRLAFECSQCDLTIRTGPIKVPSLDLVAESENRTVLNSKNVYCPECESGYDVNVIVGDPVSKVEIEGLKKIEVAELDYIRREDGTAHQRPKPRHLWQIFEDTKDNLFNVRLLLNSKEPHEHEVNQIRNKLAYSYCVTCMEAFLSDALLLHIELDKEYLKRFIEGSEDFRARKMTLDQYFQINIVEIARESINSIIFHNLPKIKAIYEAVFKTEFPEISELCKAVSTRHDIIHRNGKTKNGEVVEVFHKDIKELLVHVEGFIDKVFWGIRKHAGKSFN